MRLLFLQRVANVAKVPCYRNLIWLSYMCNYSQKEMGVVADSCTIYAVAFA